MKEMDIDYGKVNIILGEYITENKISRSKLARTAGLQYTQLLAYIRNDIQRPDLAVLARICYTLECDISDIMEYKPKLM